MRWSKTSISFVVTLAMLVQILLPMPISRAEVKSVTVTKTVTSPIETIGEAEVSLSIKGSPPVNVVMPNDVMLIIDRSGSMGGTKIIDAKNAAKGFIDLMDLTKHQIGIVDFSDTTNALSLTTDAASVKNYIDTLQAYGGTYTGDAIRRATVELQNKRTDAQPVIVILTDGQANLPEDARAAAEEAKNAGIVFYTIALLNATDNPETNTWNALLKDMATTAQHHHFVLGSTGLSDIYAAIVKQIGIASAYDVTLKDVVGPDFEIVPGSYDNNIPKPIVNGNELTWNFSELKDETLTFTYKIRPKYSNKAGTFPSTVGGTIVYKDYTGAVINDVVTGPNITVTHPKPIITDVAPNFGDIAGGNQITIKGNYFRDGVKVTVNAVSASNVQVIDSQTIKATVPTGAQGEVTLRVTNNDSKFADTTYTYQATPQVTSMTPNNGLINTENTVQINGNYFLAGAKVYFGDQEGSVEYKSPHLLNVHTPVVQTPQTVDLKVVNPDGTEVTIQNGFTYKDTPTPTISSISPNQGKLEGGEYVYIYGSNFDPKVIIKVGGKDPMQVLLIESNRIRIRMPANDTPGSVDIEVTNPDGKTAKLTNAYTYLAPPVVQPPDIQTMSLVEGKLQGGEYVFIKGLNFQKGMKVFFGDNEAEVINEYDSSEIRVIVPTATVEGAVDIKVVNPDAQQDVLTSAYTYLAPPPVPAPTIASLSQTSGFINGGDLVIVNGTGFQNGLTVKLGGQNAQVVNFYDSTRFRISIPAAATEGPVDIEVTNPDGQTVSLVGAYTYKIPTPTITSVTPNNGAFAGGNYVNIYGTYFDSNIQATVNGAPVTIAYYGSTQIRINSMPSASTLGLPDAGGIVPIVITNPNTGKSVTVNYTYNCKPTTPIPVISSIKGAGGVAPVASISGGTYLYFYGSSFSTGMKVRIYDINNTLVKEQSITNVYRTDYARNLMPAVSGAGTYTAKLVNSDGVESNGFTITYK